MTRAGPEPTELVPAPLAGRVFEVSLRPGIADVIGDGREGRARLDAIARWIQDVAYRDLVDAGLSGAGGGVSHRHRQVGNMSGRGAWVVRRARIRVDAFPRFGEDLVLRTFCSGIGRFSAERRTTISGSKAAVETVALWVCLDAETWRPMRFDPAFVAVYAESAGGRGASARRRHPEPPTAADEGRWIFRLSDLDIAGHVNNSHYWGPLEEDLVADRDPGSVDAEIEYRDPAQPGEATVLRSGGAIWITSPAKVLHASILRW